MLIKGLSIARRVIASGLLAPDLRYASREGRARSGIRRGGLMYRIYADIKIALARGTQGSD